MLGPEDISVEEHSALMNVAPGQHEQPESDISRTVMMGHSTTLQANNTATIFYATASEDATDWEVHLQVLNLQPPTGPFFSSSAGAVYGTVTYTLGESTFTKYFAVQSDAPYRFKVVGRRVQVDISWVGNTEALPPPLQIISGGGRCGFGASPLDFYVPTWRLRSILASTVLGIDIPGGWVPFITGALYTTLISWQAMLLSMPTTGQAGANACCLMFFDVTSPADLITGSLPLWVSPPFTAANQWYSFDDGTCPQVRYVNGLMCALSSTFDKYTPVGTGASFRVDSKLGS